MRFSSVLIVLSCVAAAASAQVNVPAERYSQARLGANLNETKLNTSNVNVNYFGKLWSYTVSGSVQAQPLYVQNVAITGKGTHNVLYVVTMNDVVYAFDADTNSTTPLLSLDLTTQVAGSTPVPITDILPAGNIVGNVGITSTPYIDVASNTMYLVARTKESGSACGTVNGNYCQRLHALDITSLAEKFGGPVIIQGSVAGTGSNSSGGTLVFDPKIQNQRASLAMANGQIFIGWASHEDKNAYHGWIMAYDASTLKQTKIWSTTPNGSLGGVWMGGRGPAVDASGNVYFMVGNGTWDGSTEFGESMLKFGSMAGMPLMDWFTPDTWSTLNAGDKDYGSSGPILIPGTDLIAGAGKSSIFYVMHSGNLGHEMTGNTQIVQSLHNNGGEIKAGPVYWDRSGGLGPWMYVWSDDCDYLKAYHFNGTTFDANVASQSLIRSPCGNSGGVLTISANGSTAGSGIVWSSMPANSDGDVGVHAGILRALNADDLTKEIWNSNQNAARDNSGNWPKFSAPTAVNGRVYLASFPMDGVSAGAVNVYGLLPPDFTITAAPASQTAASGGTATYTVSTMAIGGFSGTVALMASGLPSGATATFSPSSISGAGTSTLTVSTASTTPGGTYTVTITGTSGSLTHSTSVILAMNPAAPPTFSPAGGNYSSSQTVTISDATSGATIYYTTNGTTPTTSSTRYTGPITIYATTTINAMATANGFAPSSVSSATYTIGTSLTTIPQTGWTLKYVDSQASTTPATYAFDGKTTTFWHTVWSPSSAPLPHEIQISLGASHMISGFTYLPRQDGCSHGTIGLFEFYVSPDGVNWGTPVASGTFNYGTFTYACPGGTVVSARVITFAAVTGAYVRLRALSEVGGNPWTSAAEINLLAAAGAAGLTLNPMSVISGKPSQGTVTLNYAAPSGGQVVTLSSSNTAEATVPASVAVPAGQKTASFTVNTVAGNSGTVTISATANSATASAQLTLQTPVAQAGWALKFVDSQETTAGNYPATNAFDGNAATMWHTVYSPSPAPPPPHEIQINLGAAYTISGFTYLPRQDRCNNGTVKQYEFYVSADGVNWGTPVAAGTFNYGNANLTSCGSGTILPAQQVNFAAVSASYIRFRALSEVNGNPWTAVAEINALH